MRFIFFSYNGLGVEVFCDIMYEYSYKTKNEEMLKFSSVKCVNNSFIWLIQLGLKIDFGKCVKMNFITMTI